MAKQRSPKRAEARRLWREGGGQTPLKDIAAKLGVPASQVSNWKRLDAWSLDYDSRFTIGAAPANNNRESAGGAPKGNGNAVKTGLRSAIDFAALSGEDRACAESASVDAADVRDTAIRAASVTLRRVLARLHRYDSGELGGRTVTKLCRTPDGRTVKAPVVVPDLEGVQRQEMAVLQAVDRLLKAARDKDGAASRRAPELDRPPVNILLNIPGLEEGGDGDGQG